MRGAVVSFILLVAAGQPPESLVAVRYGFGLDAKSQLDTTSGLLTLDMVCDPPFSIPVTFTEAELANVFDAAQRARFFELPADSRFHPKPGPEACFRTPCQTWRLEIVTTRRQHVVEWDECACTLGPNGERAKLVADAVDAALRTKPSYQFRPRPRCMYQ